jgi:hypothetical protein
MDSEFIEAINTTADTSFDASVPTNTDASVPTNCTGDPITCPVVLNLLKKPLFYERLSGGTAKRLLDGERKPGGFPFIPTTCPEYKGPPSGRAGNDDEKRGAWQLQEEYLVGRLGKNEEENIRNWNTVLWIEKHYRVTRTPAEALPPLNIYVGDKTSQSTEGTGAPAGPDDEAPDDKVENEGFKFKRIKVDVGKGDLQGCIRVMDENRTAHILEIKADDYDVLRLIDALEEIDKLAKINVNDLMREVPPLLPQTDFPSADQRAESGKIIRTLMLGMRTLWHPVICTIADHADMKSQSQGKGKDVAAAVGRQRVIEGLRIAESIRRGLGRQEFVVRRTLEPFYTVATCLDEIIRGVLARLGGQTLDDRPATWPPYRDWQGSCCYIDGMRFLPSKPLPANDNHRFDAVALKAA